MTLCFGTFTLDVDQRRLGNRDREIRLAPKAFELLKLLIENRPKALSKDEIISRVWPDTFITEKQPRYRREAPAPLCRWMENAGRRAGAASVN